MSMARKVNGDNRHRMCVGLGETHTADCDFVDSRRVQVRRPEAVGVECALVVGQDKISNVGTSDALGDRTAAEGC